MDETEKSINGVIMLSKAFFGGESYQTDLIMPMRFHLDILIANLLRGTGLS